MSESDNEEDGELNIARRTRSHLRIDDFVPKDNLDFPDFDKNLYQSKDSEVDSEYKKFLNQCYSEEINNTTDTNTDDNDPEYVYNDDIFSHGWRFDLNEVSELNQDRNGDISCSSTDRPNFITISQDGERVNQIQPNLLLQEPHFKSPSIFKPKRRKTDMFDDPEFARILNQQLRQHIQLLTQTYLLTKNTTNMRNEAEEAKSHLDSYMMIFKNKSKPSNLLPALELVNNFDLILPKELRSSIRLSWRQLPIPETVKKVIQENPNVFVYPSLMPQAAFSILPEKLIPKKPKINFTINEDKLLAYALNEFKGESTPYAFIASLLMTAKTKTQISNHIKNIKRSPGNEENPIKLYYANGQLPEIDLDSDANLVELVELSEDDDKEEEGQEHLKDSDNDNKSLIKIELIEQNSLMDQNHISKEINDIKPLVCDEQKSTDELDHKSETSPKQTTSECGSPPQINSNLINQDHDDLMNMDLDDLMAASTTISKSIMINNPTNNNENNKNIKNLKLKKSMLNLMSHNYSLSNDMSDLIVYEFLKIAQQKLNEKNYLQLLQTLSNLMINKSKDDDKIGDNQTVVAIYHEIKKYLEKINAPQELIERIVLFLNLDQATKCGCSFNYLHWIRFFQFMQQLELYHDGVEGLEKKLVRLVDALQKDDSHKIKLAIGNLVNKHPFLKREFESLSLDEKPHPSLFLCEEDFDDVTEPIAMFDSNNLDRLQLEDIYNYEHINQRISEEEMTYASQSCRCKCHSETSSTSDGQLSQHCGNCNLKFIKGRMYLVSKIKPILAEWQYTERSIEKNREKTPPKNTTVEWTFEEDRAILEFCRSKAEHQNEETLSFDTTTFEELVKKRESDTSCGGNNCKKTAKEIAERFNQLMDLYKDENSNIQ